MDMSGSIRPLLVALCLSVFAACAGAQTQAQSQSFEPRVGQQGKDVVWVPTRQELIDKMLDMAKVTPKDYLIDLGSGDGRTVITAAKRGLRAHGIEYNPDMVELSKRNAATAGVSDKATFAKADLFESDFSEAQVITMFLLPQINLKLRPKILDLKPGTRFVSNSFTMGEWEADDSATVGGECDHWCTALLWIVPAKVEGTWQLSQSELSLKQNFQMLSGTIKTGNSIGQITNGRMIGDQIVFTAGGNQYTGRVNGNAIEGKSGSRSWKGTRTNKSG